MVGTMTACYAAPTMPEARNTQQTATARSVVKPLRASQEESPPYLVNNASDNKEPVYDAPWYTERNEELRETIRRNNPSETEDQIERDIARMAIDPDKPMVALSFDDGPTPGVTDKILDVLAQYNARATFFVCGWRFEREANQDILRRIAANGCEIGNHTWSHKNLLGQNYISAQYEIEYTNDIIYETTGVRPRCLRPPGGQNTYEAMRVARENDMAIVLWSQSGNVHEYDPSRIAQNVEKQIVNGRELQDGDVILLHDTPQCMVDAVKIIVPQLIQDGYQLVTVWELLNCKGEEIVPGAVYQER
jgi:peptidoglycan/xylan/chitin deacetylase (PgdA/CDA1 family)